MPRPPLSALVGLALLLASCGPGVTPPVDGGNGGGNTSAYVPTKDATVGTGPDAQATLRTPLGFGDVDLMNAINEFRTTGKVGGVDITAQTCLAGKFTPRNALRFNGVLHHAAYKHSVYKKATVTSGHIESEPSHPDFWGQDPAVRAARSAGLFGLTSPTVTGEGTGGSNRSGQEAAIAYLKSPAHCAIMVDPQATMIGASMFGDPTIPMPDAVTLANMTQEERGRLFQSISVHTVVLGR